MGLTFWIVMAILLLIMIAALVSSWEQRRMKAIASHRKNSSLCTYARSFDFRNVDTRIMREVYIHVQAWAGKYDGVPFPVEADDCFNEIYNMDEDELDDIYFDIADKFAISTENPESNPYWNQVTTVRNLVMFLHHQPKMNPA